MPFLVDRCNWKPSRGVPLFCCLWFVIETSTRSSLFPLTFSAAQWTSSQLNGPVQLWILVLELDILLTGPSWSTGSRRKKWKQPWRKLNFHWFQEASPWSWKNRCSSCKACNDSTTIIQFIERTHLDFCHPTILVAAFRIFLYTAVGSRPDQGGVEPRQPVAPWPGGQG